jgi:hypothetical protein
MFCATGRGHLQLTILPFLDNLNSHLINGTKSGRQVPEMPVR